MKNWQKLFGIKPKFEEENSQDDPPADDKLQALASALNDLEARVGAIETQLNSVQDDVDTITEVVDTEEFAAIRDNAKEIVTRFNDLGNKGGQRKQRQVPAKSGKFSYL